MLCKNTNYMYVAQTASHLMIARAPNSFPHISDQKRTFVHMYVLGKLNSALMSHVRLQTSYNLENSDVAYLDITRKSDCLDAQAGLCLLSHTTKHVFSPFGLYGGFIMNAIRC